MEEVFPVAAGILLGLVTYRLRATLRAVALALVSVGVGALAAWLSGELAVSWVYLLIDTAQVGAAAVMTAFAVAAWRRRRARATAG